MSTTTVRIEFNKSKTKMNGETPLYLCVTKNRKKKRLSLGISVRTEHWDIEKELPKKNCPNKEAIEKIIADKKSECVEMKMDFKALGRDYTAKTLIDSVKNPIKPMTVQTLFDEYIDSLKKANRLNYSVSYKQTMNKALEFNKHLDIPFSDIDTVWCKKFERWLRSKGLKDNTIGVYFRNLRALYNLAIEKKFVRSDNCYKVSKLKNDTLKRALTKDEIERIIKFAQKHETYLSHSPYITYAVANMMLALDLFIFMYFEGGINFNGIANLTKKNIIDNRTNMQEAFTVFFRRNC
jgi:hypothetical protein